MGHEGDDCTNCDWCGWYSHQRIGKRTGRLGNKRTVGDHTDYSIIKIGQNIETSPGDLKRLIVTRTPIREHQCEKLKKE